MVKNRSPGTRSEVRTPCSPEATLVGLHWKPPRAFLKEGGFESSAACSVSLRIEAGGPPSYATPRASFLLLLPLPVSRGDPAVLHMQVKCHDSAVTGHRAGGGRTAHLGLALTVPEAGSLTPAAARSLGRTCSLPRRLSPCSVRTWRGERPPRP